MYTLLYGARYIQYYILIKCLHCLSLDKLHHSHLEQTLTPKNINNIQCDNNFIHMHLNIDYIRHH
jgi:hypothetical protein